MWHDGLVHKLMVFNFPTYLVQVISDYLDRKTAQVNIGSSVSRTIAQLEFLKAASWARCSTIWTLPTFHLCPAAARLPFSPMIRPSATRSETSDFSVIL